MFHCNSIVQFILLNELYNYVFRKRNVMGPKQLRKIYIKLVYAECQSINVCLIYELVLYV